MASVPQQSDANQATTASDSLVVPDNQLGVTLNIDGLQTTVTPGPEDHPATVVIPSSAEDDHELSDIAVVSAVDDENPIAPVKIRVFTGNAKAPSNILDQGPEITITSTIVDGSVELLEFDIDANEIESHQPRSAFSNPLSRCNL